MAKVVNNYQRCANYLIKIFKAVNETYFNNELEVPTITIQSSLNAYGSITVSKVWKNSDGKATYELNISAEYLSRKIENIVATIIHEASHEYNLMHGIKDCSGYYHNRKFKKVAEEMGHLIISKDVKYGWTITEPSDDTIKFCLDYGFEDIQLKRDTPYSLIGIGSNDGNSSGVEKPIVTKKPKGSNSIKWVCPCCGNIARTTRPINLICGDCMEKMIRA